SLEHTHTFYEGVGCIECNGTGYKGRSAICELLDLTDHIRELILEKRPTSEIKKAAREEGMRFLRESAVERVLEGYSTLREINKVTFVKLAVSPHSRRRLPPSRSHRTASPRWRWRRAAAVRPLPRTPP